MDSKSISPTSLRIFLYRRFSYFSKSIRQMNAHKTSQSDHVEIVWNHSKCKTSRQWDHFDHKCECRSPYRSQSWVPKKRLENTDIKLISLWGNKWAQYRCYLLKNVGCYLLKKSIHCLLHWNTDTASRLIKDRHNRSLIENSCKRKPLLFTRC